MKYALHWETMNDVKSTVLLVSFVFLLTSCSSETPCPAGSEGCPCTFLGTCEENLICTQDMCTRLESSGPPNGTAGRPIRDGGMPLDTQLPPSNIPQNSDASDNGASDRQEQNTAGIPSDEGELLTVSDSGTNSAQNSAPGSSDTGTAAPQTDTYPALPQITPTESASNTEIPTHSETAVATDTQSEPETDTAEANSNGSSDTSPATLAVTVQPILKFCNTVSGPDELDIMLMLTVGTDGFSTQFHARTGCCTPCVNAPADATLSLALSASGQNIGTTQGTFYENESVAIVASRTPEGVPGIGVADLEALESTCGEFYPFGTSSCQGSDAFVEELN